MDGADGLPRCGPSWASASGGTSTYGPNVPVSSVGGPGRTDSKLDSLGNAAVEIVFAEGDYVADLHYFTPAAADETSATVAALAQYSHLKSGQ